VKSVNFGEIFCLAVAILLGHKSTTAAKHFQRCHFTEFCRKMQASEHVHFGVSRVSSSMAGSTSRSIGRSTFAG
jgi:hypothetical protein